MYFSPRFRQGVKAAIPIWIAFIPSSIAFGVAAQAHGLHLGEVILMSAWVYSGPAQFAVLSPHCRGKVVPANSSRRLPDEPSLPADEHGSGALFSGRGTLAIAVCISRYCRQQFYRFPISTFDKNRESRGGAAADEPPFDGQSNLSFFLGVGITSFLVWVVGTGVGT